MVDVITNKAKPTSSLRRLLLLTGDAHDLYKKSGWRMAAEDNTEGKKVMFIKRTAHWE